MRFAGEQVGGKKEDNFLDILQTFLLLNTFGKSYINSTAPQYFTWVPWTIGLVLHSCFQVPGAAFHAKGKAPMHFYAF